MKKIKIFNYDKQIITLNKFEKNILIAAFCFDGITPTEISKMYNEEKSRSHYTKVAEKLHKINLKMISSIKPDSKRLLRRKKINNYGRKAYKYYIDVDVFLYLSLLYLDLIGLFEPNKVERKGLKYRGLGRRVENK